MNYCTDCDAIVTQSPHERREDSREAPLMPIAEWPLLQYRYRWIEKLELATRFSTAFSVDCRHGVGRQNWPCKRTLLLSETSVKQIDLVGYRRATHVTDL